MGVIAAAFVLVLIVVFTLMRKKRRVARLSDHFLEEVKVTDMLHRQHDAESVDGSHWDDGSSPPGSATAAASSVPQASKSPTFLLEAHESDTGGEAPAGDLFTRLLIAVSCNDVDRLRLLLSEADNSSSPGSSPGVVPMEQDKKLPLAVLTQTDVAGNTLLAWAVRFGCVESVRVLLEAGSSVHTVNLQGHRPIHMACMSNPNLEIVKMLVDAGAKVNLPDFEGTSAFLYACRSGDHALVELLLPSANLFNTDNRNMTPLMLAACFGHVNIVDAILSSVEGDNLERLLNWQDVKGWTALHWTVSVGELVCAERILREPRLNVCVCNMFGESALHLACREDEPSLTMLLLNDQYIKPRALLLKFVSLTTEEGFTALQYAQKSGSLRCADFVENCVRSLCHEWRLQGKAWLGNVSLPRSVVDKYFHGIDDGQSEDANVEMQTSPDPDACPPARKSAGGKQSNLQKRKAQDDPQDALLPIEMALKGEDPLGLVGAHNLQLPTQADLIDPFSSTSEDAGTFFDSPFSPSGFSPDDIFSFPSIPVAAEFAPTAQADSGLSFSSVEDSVDEKDDIMSTLPSSDKSGSGAAAQGGTKGGKAKQVKRRRRKVTTEGLSATEAARRERRREAWHQKQEEERMYVERLQKQISELESENKKLSSSMQMMQAESKRLKMLVSKC